jgi:UDP-N-acetylglucosamine diphosphorylase/glucosamine-1-phosphate N-acetyltransferase
MPTMRFYLFDDRRARRWAPFTLTRPAGELLYGCLSLRERAERALGLECTAHVSRTVLVGFDEPGAAPAIAPRDLSPDGPLVLLSSRAALESAPVQLPTGPATLIVDRRVAGWILPDRESLASERWLKDPASASLGGERVELPGRWLEHPWDLMAGNEERVARDIEELWPVDASAPGALRVGDHRLSLGEGAVVEPGVHLDLRDGPIRLAEGARVEGPARLTGPLYVGPGSTVLGGTVGTSSIGPVSLVRGEVAASILLGYVNKAHDGHLGHAIVGRWVNLGAFTTNSDLKNNYRSVRVWTPEGEKDTGMLKVGCFFGDHVKTGIGTVINTGSVIGAGSNVYGGLMPPTVVPPFSWGAGSDYRDHRLDKFMETAEAVMARRGQELTPGVTEILRVAWTETAGRRAE